MASTTSVRKVDPLELIARGDTTGALQFLLDYWGKHERGKNRGPRVPKRLPGIWKAVCSYIQENPRATVEECWVSFPEPEPGTLSDALIYREAGKLWAVNDVTGQSESITRRSFERWRDRGAGAFPAVTPLLRVRVR